MTSFAENGPLAATLLADTFLEQAWLATAPETWFASPLIVVFTYAFAMASGRASGPQGAIARLTTAIRSHLDACATVALALRELRLLSGAREVLVAVDGGSAPTSLFSEHSASEDGAPPHGTLTDDERSTYFFEPPVQAPQSNGVVSFEASGPKLPAAFRRAHECQSLTGVAWQADAWEGRLLFLDRAPDRDVVAAYREFVALLHQLIPATARVCDLHAQRHRAAGRARARLGRDLHDGIVQELACLDIELELIGVAAAPHPGMRQRLGRVQERLRAELSALRALLQDARLHDVDASRLPAVLETMVERFGRDSRMHADYVSHVTEVRLPPHVCGEIARIVQEALVNVRRHSGARHVVVTFSCDNANWKVSIQDDGRGFDAARRTRSDASPRAPLPPSVIHERAHSLGGTVRVVAPGPSGARIEISAQRDLWNRMT